MTGTVVAEAQKLGKRACRLLVADCTFRLDTSRLARCVGRGQVKLNSMRAKLDSLEEHYQGHPCNHMQSCNPFFPKTDVFHGFPSHPSVRTLPRSRVPATAQRPDKIKHGCLRFEFACGPSCRWPPFVYPQVHEHMCMWPHVLATSTR